MIAIFDDIDLKAWVLSLSFTPYRNRGLKPWEYIKGRIIGDTEQANRQTQKQNHKVIISGVITAF